VHANVETIRSASDSSTLHDYSIGKNYMIIVLENMNRIRFLTGSFFSFDRTIALGGKWSILSECEND
jgi:hypothetical protein